MTTIQAELATARHSPIHRQPLTSATLCTKPERLVSENDFDLELERLMEHSVGELLKSARMDPKAFDALRPANAT
ncbi:hypothetical protein [Burkholderia sp. Ac-20379]|uniref:hypothetical protein n=1 Tax=Burkholderia sp. Ac-20379 TaxID=2703900 RepID=UPI0019818C76|nr:hypothetical protein [Burkholderia sp. Ac-20379]MBN3722593.1 hypothetical protein [Burkholderia sp. Ac-20379]